MHSNLARALLAKGVIAAGTVLQAQQSVKGLSGQRDATAVGRFTVQGAKLVGGRSVIFETTGETGSRPLRAEEVVLIDGMAIDRVALSLQLTLEGDDVPRRPRRGRRKKTELLA